MKPFFTKHAQSITLGLVALVISGGIVAAAPMPIYTSITQGFIRIATEGFGYFRYGYGYGYIGQLFGYGYGYGYDARDRLMHLMSGGSAASDPSLFGFGGKSGAATITSFTSGYGPYGQDMTEGYGFAIGYTTTYLSKAAVLLYKSTSYNVEKGNYGFDGAPETYNSESNFVSGARSYSTSGLECGTHYLVAIGVVDAGGNRWKSEGIEFATADCEGGSETSTPATTTPQAPDTQTITQTTGAYSRAVGTPFYPVNRDNLPIPPINPRVSKPTALPISPVLRQGASGPGPKLLQKTLNYLGFTVAETGAGSPGNETEFFGPKTQAALGKFQSAYGLKSDGIYGPMTKAIISALIK